MSKQAELNELTNDIKQVFLTGLVYPDYIAHHLYNEGYRKQNNNYNEDAQFMQKVKDLSRQLNTITAVEAAKKEAVKDFAKQIIGYMNVTTFKDTNDECLLDYQDLWETIHELLEDYDKHELYK